MSTIDFNESGIAGRISQWASTSAYSQDNALGNIVTLGNAHRNHFKSRNINLAEMSKDTFSLLI